MSTIKLTKFRWGNIFSYGDDNELDLSEHTLTQILGPNGAGKSSIPLVLQEGLFNKNSKGFKKAELPNRHTQEPYYINIGFFKDEVYYEIDIKKASTLKATLTEDGEDISAHTPSGTIKKIEGIIQMDFKTFVQLIYQSTDSSLQFLKATDSKRKEFLVQLFDLASYGEKYAKFNAALKDLTLEINKVTGSIESETKNLNRVKKLLDIEVGEELEEPTLPDDLREEKAALQAKLDNIEKERKEITDSNRILKQLEGLRTEEEIQEEIEALGDIPSKDGFVERLGRHNSEIKSAKAIVSKIEGLDGKCHACLQPVDKSLVDSMIEENSKIIEDNRVKAEECVTRIKEIEEQERSLKNLRVEIQQRRNIEGRKKYDEYMEAPELDDLKVHIDSLTKEINEVTSEIEKVRKHNMSVAGNLAKKVSAEEQLKEIDESFATQVEKLSKLEAKIGPLETLKKAFSPTGLVAYKLENKVQDLEVETNKYLADLSDGKFNLAFELNNDKLNVVIYADGEPVGINTLSSGEHSRVVIGTLLGIRKIMQSIAKTTINVLFLDEVISVLDDPGKEKLVEVLLKEKGLNTFLVSHGWEHPLVNKLVVTKEENISEIS
jgi:DNA repair exonuclease SbcCD ATPase subunit